MTRNTHVIVVEGAMPKVRRAKYGSVNLHLYSIGWMSAMCNLARVTLRGWEKQGIIPPPIFDFNGSYRYYSAQEIEQYASLINAHYAGDRNIKVLTRKLHDAKSAIKRNYELTSKKPTPVVDKLKNFETLQTAFQQLNSPECRIPQRNPNRIKVKKHEGNKNTNTRH